MIFPNHRDGLESSQIGIIGDEFRWTSEGGIEHRVPTEDDVKKVASQIQPDRQVRHHRGSGTANDITPPIFFIYLRGGGTIHFSNIAMWAFEGNDHPYAPYEITYLKFAGPVEGMDYLEDYGAWTIDKAIYTASDSSSVHSDGPQTDIDAPEEGTYIAYILFDDVNDVFSGTEQSPSSYTVNASFDYWVG